MSPTTPTPFVSSEVETLLRAKSRMMASARRRALLGGPDAPERLREADRENESRERGRVLTFYLLAVLGAALLMSLSWSESLADLWNLVWFIPVALFGALIWYGFEQLGGALCNRAALPLRTHTYTPNYYVDEEEEAPDYSMAEVIDEDEARGFESLKGPRNG